MRRSDSESKPYKYLYLKMISDIFFIHAAHNPVLVTFTDIDKHVRIRVFSKFEGRVIKPRVCLRKLETKDTQIRVEITNSRQLVIWHQQQQRGLFSPLLHHHIVHQVPALYLLLSPSHRQIYTCKIVMIYCFLFKVNPKTYQ